MVALTFPDGARRDYPTGMTGLDIAKGISPSLAKRTVAMALDGTVADLSDKIERDAKIEFLTREDPRALELIRHDCAHATLGLLHGFVLAHGLENGGLHPRIGRRLPLRDLLERRHRHQLLLGLPLHENRPEDRHAADHAGQQESAGSPRKDLSHG